MKKETGETKICKHCKTEIPAGAKICPNCRKKQGGKLKWIIIAVVVIGVIGAAIGGGNKENPTQKADDVKTEDVATTSNDAANVQKADDATAEKPDVPAEYKSALKKAESYSNTMHMSKQGIYDQLTSEYGEKFSPEAAQYAVDNVKADWNANALEKAKDYQDTMAMSPESIRDQLTSENGEQFTQEEADYAIANLPQ